MPCLEARHVVLVGEMGVGKTTVGEAVAQRLGVPFLDSDAVLGSRTGRRGADIARNEGVEALHAAELSAYLEMIRTPPQAVIAPAASVIDSGEARATMLEHDVIWLTASDEELERRQRSGDHRRAVDATERLALRKRRKDEYHEVSDLQVDTSARSVGEVVDEVMAHLERGR